MFSCHLSLVVHVLLFLRTLLMTDVFQAADAQMVFGLTNDLTSRTARTASLHMSKCLLTTSLSLQAPTLIGDASQTLRKIVYTSSIFTNWTLA